MRPSFVMEVLTEVPAPRSGIDLRVSRDLVKNLGDTN